MKCRWIALGLIVLWSVGCIAQEATRIVDQAGYTVSVPSTASRIASVYGIGTYTVYALGGEDRLALAFYVGVKTVASASDVLLRWEPRLSEILGFGDPNVEELVSLRTDLVLADASRHLDVAEQLRDLGVPVVLYRVETPEALIESVILTGQVLGPESATLASEWIADYDRVVVSISEDTASLAEAEKARVLFLGTSLSTVASGDMYQTSLIRAAGGRSVTAELTGSWNEVNLEQILRWNPDVIVIPPYGPVQPSAILENADWQALDAVKTGRVYRMPRLVAPMDTPVPESLLGIAWLASTLYPERVRLDLAAEVAGFYEKYYRFPLTQDEIGRIAQ